MININTILNIARDINEKGGNMLLLRDTPLLPNNVRDISICDTWEKLNLKGCSISYQQDMHTRKLQDQVFDKIIELGNKEGLSIYEWDPSQPLYDNNNLFSYKDSDQPFDEDRRSYN